MSTVMVDMSPWDRLDLAMDQPLQARRIIEIDSVLNNVLVETKIISKYLISTLVSLCQ